MADDDVVSDVPLPHTRHLVPFNKETAAAAARKKAKLESERRVESQKQARLRAATVLGDAASNADAAGGSRALDGKSVEELADMAVRRMAKIVLLGGEAFAPTTLREASEAATAWENIAYKETARRKAVERPEEDDTPAEAAAKAMRQLRTKLAEQKKAG